MRDLGELGEDTFKLWCSQAGLIANPSRTDKTGWDFHIESSQNYKSLSGEIHSAPLVYKVQVKATDKRNRKLAVPLSNLWRMATLQMPTYYAFLEFDEENEAQNAFLVHMDSELVGKILERLHKNEQKDKPAELHKITYTLRYGEQHKLKQLDGDSLFLQLNKPINNDMAKYIADKKQYLETIGYGDDAYSFLFSLDKTDAINLLDSSLGFESTVKVFSVTARKKRFGIYNKEPVFNHESGILRIDAKPFSFGKIIFRENSFSAGLSFDVSVYTPVFLGSLLPPEHKKLRVKSDLFDIIWFTETSKLTVDFTFSGKVEIRQLSKVLKLMQILKSNFQVELDLDIGEQPLKFNSNGADTELISYENESSAIQQIQMILDAFEFRDFIELTLDEVSSFSSVYLNFIELLNVNLVSKANKEFVVKTTFTEVPEIKEGSNITLSSATIRIGDYIFGVVFSIKGDYKKVEGNSYILQSNDYKCEEKFVLKIGQDSISEVRETLISSASDKYEANGYDVFIVKI